MDEFNYEEFFKGLDNIENRESKCGTWEYLYFKDKDKVVFQYWTQFGSKPETEIELTKKEFNNLIKFIKNLKLLK